MPLVGRGGRGGADQVLALHEVPVIGRASFEGQRRGNVGDVGAGHPIELQIGLDAEGEFGPGGDGRRGRLRAGRRRRHREAALAGHHVQHLALGSLRPQGADRF